MFTSRKQLPLPMEGLWISAYSIYVGRGKHQRNFPVILNILVVYREKGWGPRSFSRNVWILPSEQVLDLWLSTHVLRLHYQRVFTLIIEHSEAGILHRAPYSLLWKSHYDHPSFVIRLRSFYNHRSLSLSLYPPYLLPPLSAAGLSLYFLDLHDFANVLSQSMHTHCHAVRLNKMNSLLILLRYQQIPFDSILQRASDVSATWVTA